MSMICFLFKDFEILITWGETEAVFFLLVLFWKQFQGESGRKKVGNFFGDTSDDNSSHIEFNEYDLFSWMCLMDLFTFITQVK